MLALILGLIGGIPNRQGASPGSYLERALLAEEHAERGEWEAAALAMRRAIELAPDAPISCLELALYEARRGAESEALAALERAIELGFRDDGYLEWEPGFATLRQSEAFVRLPAQGYAIWMAEPPNAELTSLRGCSVRALSADGERVLVSDHGKRTRLLDAITGDVLADLPDQEAAAFDPTGRYLLTSEESRGIVLWDAHDGRFLREFDSGARVLAFEHGFRAVGRMGFDTHSSLLCCDSRDGLRAWCFPSGERVELAEPDPVWNWSLDPDGQWVIVGKGGVIRRIDLVSGAVAWQTALSDEGGTWFCLSRDARRLAVADPDAGIWILDTESGSSLWKHKVDWLDGLDDLQFDPRSDELVTSSYAGLQWWGEDTHRPRRELELPRDGGMRAMDFAAGGEVVILSDEGLPPFAVDSKTGAILWNGLVASWTDVIDSDGLLVTSADDGSILFLDPRSGSVQRRLASGRLSIERPIPLPDGKRGCVCAADGSLRVFDLATGRGEKRGWSHSASARVVGVGGNGRWLATADGTTVRTWNLETGVSLVNVSGTDALPCPIDERLLVLRGDHAVIVSAIDAGEILELRAGNEPIEACTWSPDGRRVACALGSHVVQVWDSETGASVARPFVLDGKVCSMGFDPSSALFAAAARTGDIGLWQIDNASRIRWLSTSDGSAPDVRFSSDGRTFLVTTSVLRSWYTDRPDRAWQGGFTASHVFHPETAPESARVYASAVDLSHRPAVDDDTEAFVFEAGRSPRSFPLRGLFHAVPSPGERWITAHWRESTSVMNGSTLAPLYFRIEMPDEGELLHLPNLFCRGSSRTAFDIPLRVGDRTHRLEAFASELLAPELFAAGVAGVWLSPHDLPPVPSIVSHEAEMRRTSVEGETAILRAVAEDPRGLVGFQIEVDGRTLAWELAGKTVHLDDTGRRAELELYLERPANDEVEVCVRAVSRTGVLSLPWLQTVRWR